MSKIGGEFVMAPSAADFVLIWNGWVTIPGFVMSQVYCWAGIQDPTIGQVDGQPAGTTRWGACAWGYLQLSNGQTVVGVEKFTITAEGIGAMPSNISGLPGALLLSPTGILPKFVPF